MVGVVCRLFIFKSQFFFSRFTEFTEKIAPRYLSRCCCCCFSLTCLYVFFPLVLFCVFLFSFLSLYLFLIIIVVTNVVVVSLFFRPQKTFSFLWKNKRNLQKIWHFFHLLFTHFSYGEKSIQSVIVVGGRRKIGKSHTNSNAATTSTRFSLLIEATTDWFSVVGGSCLYYCCCRSFYFFLSTLLFFAFILFKLCFHYYFFFTIGFFLAYCIQYFTPARPPAGWQIETCLCLLWIAEQQQQH